MNEREYNGWTNYETWVVNLWIDNDQGTQEYWLERAGFFLEEAKGHINVTDGIWKEPTAAAMWLSGELKDSHADGTTELEGVDGTVYADLLGAALSEVDWREIAESIVNNATEQAEYEATP